MSITLDSNLLPSFSQEQSRNSADFTPRALLLGEGMRTSARLIDSLRTKGFRCEFAASLMEARELMRQCHFTLALSDVDIPDATAENLMACFYRFDSNLFFSIAVLNGWWWLPAIRNGRACLGAQALPAKEFTFVVDEIVLQAYYSHLPQTPFPDIP